jgi:hypothetical protein
MSDAVCAPADDIEPRRLSPRLDTVLNDDGDDLLLFAVLCWARCRRSASSTACRESFCWWW